MTQSLRAFSILRREETEEATQPTYEHCDGNCDVLDTLGARPNIPPQGRDFRF